MTVPRAWVLLHGTPLDPDVWTGLSPFLRTQQPVIAPEVNPPVGHPRPQQPLAERLAETLPRVADQWDVVGHSFGGQIAIELALLAPERVATLAVVCSRDTPFPSFAQAATGLRDGAAIDLDGALQRWFTPAELQAGHQLIAYARERLTSADRPSWATALDGIATYDRAGSVHLIHTPTLLVCAGLDPVSDPAAMRALADRLPNGQLHIDADAAHLSPFLQPARLAARLTDHRQL